jgi:hypothetical protein
MKISFQKLRYDPLVPLLDSGIEPVIYFTKRDILAKKVPPISTIWDLDIPRKIIRKQKPDGSWVYPGRAGDSGSGVKYNLLETFKQTGVLIEQYGFTKEHPAMEKASGFLFSCQTDKGDFRGLLANQYMPYYHGIITERLVKAGYESDARIKKAFDWLIGMRQDDGGWAVPVLTAGIDWDTIIEITGKFAETIEPDRSKPFAHMCTGMVIRAFASHPKYRKSKEASHAANLLKSRFFKPDVYSSYKDADYWLRFQYPFWWNNLIAAVDSCLKVGISRDDPDISRALEWFIENQQPDGTWKVSYMKSKKPKKENSRDYETRIWITYVICRLFKS